MQTPCLIPVWCIGKETDDSHFWYCTINDNRHNDVMTMKNTQPTQKSRVERRKEATKARVVEAAEKLMRERGVDSVSIQDITDAADIGHGTFYLHFKNKAEVLQPVIERQSAAVHARVDEAAAGAIDPAIRVALGMRILLRTIAEDPLWGWYAARSGTPFHQLVADMGAPPIKDMRKALQSGRFQVTTPQATSNFIDGALVGMINSIKEGAPAAEVADATAELVLRVLGISAEEAREIALAPHQFN